MELCEDAKYILFFQLLKFYMGIIKNFVKEINFSQAPSPSKETIHLLALKDKHPH